MRVVTVKDLSRVIVDSAVQEKAIAYPTDSRLLEIARRKLVKLALEEGLTLRRRAGGYAHAKQLRRLKRVLRRQRTVLGCVIRDIERKIDTYTTRTLRHVLLERAQRLRTQHKRERQALCPTCAGSGMYRKGQSETAL